MNIKALRAIISSWLNKYGPVRRAFRYIKPIPLGSDSFLAHCRKIVHVGANDGHERFLYESANVQVIWVEAIPDVFVLLKEHIRGFRDQCARQGLAADTAGKRVTFHIANNRGASSSMFDFADHAKIFPDVRYQDHIELETVKLDELLVDVTAVDALVLDTQGSELLVLKGAERLIESCRFIKAEAADFECYEGGCTIDDLNAFLGSKGFVEASRHEFAAQSDVGRCFDVVWQRTSTTNSVPSGSAADMVN